MILHTKEIKTQFFIGV